MTDILTQLNALAALYRQRAMLLAAQDAALPKALQAKLAAITARFAPELEASQHHIQLMEKTVKEAVLRHGQTVKGSALQAVYVEGRATWDDHALQGYAITHAELFCFRRVGSPSVTLRTVKEDAP